MHSLTAFGPTLGTTGKEQTQEGSHCKHVLTVRVDTHGVFLGTQQRCEIKNGVRIRRWFVAVVLIHLKKCIDLP